MLDFLSCQTHRIRCGRRERRKESRRGRGIRTHTSEEEEKREREGKQNEKKTIIATTKTATTTKKITTKKQKKEKKKTEVLIKHNILEMKTANFKRPKNMIFEELQNQSKASAKRL